MKLYALGVVLAVTSLHGCTARSAGPNDQDPMTPNRSPRDGIYAACGGAYAHIESLTLRSGTFEHFIQTHGIYGARSRGSYQLVGDTVMVSITQTDTAIAGVRQPLRLRYNFVRGEYAGFPVLWRGTEASIRAVADNGTMSQYAALFYAGPDPARRQVPSCEQVRQKLRGESS